MTPALHRGFFFAKSVAMRKLHSHNIGIDQGSLVLFSDFEEGGEMWTGKGDRRHETPVLFSEPFREPPSVLVSLSMWDMDQKHNHRADISARDITEAGFAIVFQTWGDTRVARVRADWLAMGSLDDDLDWDVR